jgi:hypothetical protein
MTTRRAFSLLSPVIDGTNFSVSNGLICGGNVRAGFRAVPGAAESSLVAVFDVVSCIVDVSLSGGEFTLLLVRNEQCIDL